MMVNQATVCVTSDTMQPTQAAIHATKNAKAVMDLETINVMLVDQDYSKMKIKIATAKAVYTSKKN